MERKLRRFAAGRWARRDRRVATVGDWPSDAARMAGCAERTRRTGPSTTSQDLRSSSSAENFHWLRPSSIPLCTLFKTTVKTIGHKNPHFRRACFRFPRARRGLPCLRRFRDSRKMGHLAGPDRNNRARSSPLRQLRPKGSKGRAPSRRRPCESRALSWSENTDAEDRVRPEIFKLTRGTASLSTENTDTEWTPQGSGRAGKATKQWIAALRRALKN